MPANDRNRHKICHCTADCNRLLGLKQRKNHYQLVSDPSTICRSTTPSDEDDNETSESSNGGPAAATDANDVEYQDGEDIEMAGHTDGNGQASDGDGEDLDTGQEAGDGFFDENDRNNWEFHPEGNFDDFLTLQEIEEELEDLIGPANDLEMWNLRKQHFQLISLMFSI
jgi:hypothetical protein